MCPTFCLPQNKSHNKLHNHLDIMNEHTTALKTFEHPMSGLMHVFSNSLSVDSWIISRSFLRFSWNLKASGKAPKKNKFKGKVVSIVGLLVTLTRQNDFFTRNDFTQQTTIPSRISKSEIFGYHSVNFVLRYNLLAREMIFDKTSVSLSCDWGEENTKEQGKS